MTVVTVGTEVTVVAVVTVVTKKLFSPKNFFLTKTISHLKFFLPKIKLFTIKPKKSQKKIYMIVFLNAL